MKKYPKINSHLLNVLVRKRFKTIKAFSDHLDMPYQNLYNWCAGICSPSPEDVELMSVFLGVSAQIFYVPGTEFLRMGIETALSRWALEQHELDAPTLSNNDALQFLKHAEPNIVEETADETKEEEFAVPGPQDVSDSTE